MGPNPTGLGSWREEEIRRHSEDAMRRYWQRLVWCFYGTRSQRLTLRQQKAGCKWSRVTLPALEGANLWPESDREVSPPYFQGPHGLISTFSRCRGRRRNLLAAPPRPAPQIWGVQDKAGSSLCLYLNVDIVIRQIDKLLNKICFLLLPRQLHLHKNIEENMAMVFLWLKVSKM